MPDYLTDVVRDLFLSRGKLEKAAYRDIKKLDDAGTKLTSRNLIECVSILTWMGHEMNYVRKTEEFGLTPSQVLNHSFFSPLRLELRKDSALPLDKIDEHHVIVSFPKAFNEINPFVKPESPVNSRDASFEKEPARFSSLATNICHSCGKTNAPHYTEEEEAEKLYFCGSVCYEFNYLFKKRTAWR